MLDEAPDSLIYSAIEGFETQPDIASLQRILQTQAKIEELRSAKLEQLRTEVKTLETELEQLNNDLKVLSQPTTLILQMLGETAGENALQMINAKASELDNEKVSLAKQLTELENNINQATMAKIEATRRIEDAAQQKEQALAASVASNLNTNSMKISLFRRMGVHIEEVENSDKIMIFDKGNNLASVLEVDPKYLDYFISNHVWERIGNTV